MTYLKYLGPPETATIRLRGVDVLVERARLGRHLLLGELRSKITKALEGRDAEQAIQCLRDYLATACGADSDSLVEMVDAADVLWTLNAFRERLAFMEAAPSQPKAEQEAAFDYSDRYATIWVDAIARAYSWSEEQIFNLWPEIAGYYFQEIMLHDTSEREWDYTVHGMSVGKGGRYRPYPRPRWMTVTPKEQVMLIPRAIMPVGNVVRFGGESETSKP